MPDAITNTGIQTKTFDEISKELVADLAAIYGDDINIDQDSPDGQMAGIFATAATDIRELIKQVHAGFDPDQAVGRVLDQRCAINGIVRAGGTYTQTTIVVSTDRALTLNGLDTPSPFTVSDSAGTQFVLKTTVALESAGDHELDFRASESGAVEVQRNAITTPVTIILGVTGVNNPRAPYATGVDEESDYALRIRRSRAIALPNQGYLDGIIASLLTVPDVTEAIVYENPTASEDADGTPPHSIWAIVEGGLDKDVAAAINLKRNAGCGMRGETEVNVPQANGTVLKIKFDRPVTEPLWIKFNVISTTGEGIDEEFLAARILELYTFSINQKADTTTLVSLIRQIIPTAFVTAPGVSRDNALYEDMAAPSTKRGQFELALGRIIINPT